MDNKLKYLFYVGGIFVAYFYYGIIQERITKGTYANNEKFNCVLSLMFLQTAVNYGFAYLSCLLLFKHQEDSTKSKYYVLSSLSYLFAMLCSNLSLQWVSYPTQVIGKSGKPIPVMILGVILGKKSYPFRKYIFVTLIVIGVALFMYKDKGNVTTSFFGIGEVLLIISLIMDGFTGAVQERMRNESRTKSGPMMLNMNKWSMFFLLTAIVLTGEIYRFVDFIKRNPNVVWEIASFTISSALGQLFIFMTISEYGPLPCAIATTTRKFFTILGSVMLFGNSLLPRQWLAAVIVFFGLFLDTSFGKQATKRRKSLK